ncbi:K(+)-transporting ATPase subunit F [Pandoraea nosoerga]|nr:K(+)-transporting ATPase subunit F [Pandoraea nosoerga]
MDWLYLGAIAVLTAATVGFVAFCASLGGAAMTAMYWLSGALTLALLAYLVYALFKPEDLA